MSVTQQEISVNTTKDISKVAKGAGISFIGSVIARCLWFACQVITARSFGSEVFGVYVLGLVVFKMTEPFARLGLHAGAMRFVSIYHKNDIERTKGVLISAVIISFFNGLIIGGCVYFYGGFLSEQFFNKQGLSDIVKTFALCIPFMATMNVVASVSRGFHTTKYFVITKYIVQNSVNLVLIIFFILSGCSIFWVINAFIISHAIALIAGIYFIVKQFPGIIDRTLKPVYEIKRLLQYSVPLLLNGFLQFLLLWTSTIMLGYLSTPKDVGIFRAASQFPVLLILILTANQSIYSPSIAEMFHLGQMERLKKIFKTTTYWIFFISLPLAIIMIFSAKELMAIFGPEYLVASVPVLIILTIGQLVNCVTGGVMPTLNMTGKQHIEMSNSIILILTNIILSYFLIPKYGCLGAAYATAITIGSVNLLRLLEVYIIYKIHPYSINYIHGIGSGLIAVIILYILDKYMPDHSTVIGLMSNAFIVGVIFFASFVIMGLRDEDRLIFDKIVKKFNSKLFIFSFLFRTNAKSR